MKQKHLIIGGIVLLAVIFIAGVVFSPSGFLLKPGENEGVKCIKLGTSSEPCGGPNSYWAKTTFKSKAFCQAAHDDAAKPCSVCGGSCKYIQ